MAEHTRANTESQCWTDLPLPCWRLLMTHLYSQRSLSSCSATCKSLMRVADELATDLRRVPAVDLTRALAVFDRAISVAINFAPEQLFTRWKRGDRSRANQREGPEVAADYERWCVAAAVLVRELCDVPYLVAARIERLSVSDCPTGVAEELAYALQCAAPAWRRLARLELGFTSSADRLYVEWDAVVRAAGALPVLRRLRLVGANPFLDHLLSDSLLLAGLRDLEIVDVPVQSSMSVWDDGGVLVLPQLPDLLRLSMTRAPRLSVLTTHLTALKELCISDAPDFVTFAKLAAFSALTALRLHACPNAVLHDAAWPPTTLADLPLLRTLELTGTTTLERLPEGVSALVALTSLVVDVRLRDRGPEGPEPEDFAPLGRGGGGDAGLLRCFGLRRLVVRGFNGPLHLPEGMERFSLLEELDLGGCQELWNLGPWLLRLPALKRLVVPRRSVQQGVFEALALRNDPHQVEVVEEGGGSGAGGWGRGGGEGHDGDEGLGWRNDDAVSRAEEGL